MVCLNLELFSSGYNAYSKNRVSNDWIKLEKLMDIIGILALISKENPNRKWIIEIEDAMEHSIRILKK
jgi:hypothetical protein